MLFNKVLLGMLTFFLPITCLFDCVPYLDTNYASCPCEQGWKCCQGENVCVPDDETCSCDGVTCSSPPDSICIKDVCEGETDVDNCLAHGVCDWGDGFDGEVCFYVGEIVDDACEDEPDVDSCLDHEVCAWGDRGDGKECFYIGAINTPTLDDTTLRVYRRSGRCEFGKCKYDFVDAACDEGCEDGVCKGELCPGVCLSSPLDNALPADCERDYDMMTLDVLCLDTNKACCVP